MQVPQMNEWSVFNCESILKNNWTRQLDVKGHTVISRTERWNTPWLDSVLKACL